MDALSVVVTDYGFPNLDAERTVLSQVGANVDGRKCKTEAEVIEATRHADAVLTQFAPVTATAIAAMERCRVIVRYGVGVDNVDLAAARERGIPVASVPDYAVNEVSDHALTLLLGSVRKLPQVVERVRQGIWEINPLRPTMGLEGFVLGLLGFGRIAQAVARRAAPFGMRVIAHDPYVPANVFEAEGVQSVSFDAVLERSDAMSIHMPLTPETHHLIGANAFSHMKPSAYLVNTSRGPVVDEEALAAAIQAGRLAGAALDVLEQEPPKPDNPLLHLPNVLITSHCAWYSEASLTRLQQLAAEEVARVFRGDRPKHVVNGV